MQDILIIYKWIYSIYLKKKKHDSKYRYKSCYFCKKRIYWWQKFVNLIYNNAVAHRKCYDKRKGEIPKPLIIILNKH